MLYAQSADRGSNLYLLDKTVSAAQTDADHWTVTLTFWAQYEDTQPVPVPGTQETWPASTATVGYSQSMLDLERTADGWRFTSFCPSDDLDLDAETVFTFCYGPDAFAADAIVHGHMVRLQAGLLAAACRRPQRRRLTRCSPSGSWMIRRPGSPPWLLWRKAPWKTRRPWWRVRSQCLRLVFHRGADAV